MESQKKPNVLLVEDDPQRNTTIPLLLGEVLNFNVVTTVDAARTAINTDNYDVVITDGKLGEKSLEEGGVAVIQYAVSKNIAAIIGISAEEWNVHEMRRAGATYGVTKGNFDSYAILTHIKDKMKI